MSCSGPNGQFDGTVAGRQVTVAARMMMQNFPPPMYACSVGRLSIMPWLLAMVVIPMMRCCRRHDAMIYHRSPPPLHTRNSKDPRFHLEGTDVRLSDGG